MLLKFSTWSEIETYLGKRQDVFIPIGATEQHGPFGLIGTDAICAEGIATAVGERDGVLVAPSIQVGMSLHHMKFPGSMSLTPQSLIGLTLEWVDSLAAHGFNQFHFVNGHGGNIATLGAAFSEVYLKHPNVRCLTTSWYELPPLQAATAQYFGDGEGYHGTPSELSVSFFLYPEQRRETQPLDDSPLVDDQLYSAADFRRCYPDGRIGANQHLADPKIGEKLFGIAVDAVLERHRKWTELK